MPYLCCASSAMNHRCTPPTSLQGWVGQIRIKGVQASSCKHLKAVRGEENEAARCQSSAGVVANPSSNKNKNPSIVSRISLAAKWKPSIDPTGYLMSEKLDGMRAYWCVYDIDVWICIRISILIVCAVSICV